MKSGNRSEDELTLPEAAQRTGMPAAALRRAVADGTLRFRVACERDDVAILCTEVDLAAWRSAALEGGAARVPHGAMLPALEEVQADIAAAEVVAVRIAAFLEHHEAEFGALQERVHRLEEAGPTPSAARFELQQALSHLLDVRACAHLALWLTQQRLARAASLLQMVAQGPDPDAGQMC